MIGILEAKSNQNTRIACTNKEGAALQEKKN